MINDLEITQPQGKYEINIHEGWELEYWSKYLGVSEQRLRDIVNKVGPNLKNVKSELGIK